MRYILLIGLMLVSACQPVQLSDARVQRKETGTKTECRQVIGGNGGCVDVEVPAYFLISSENMICEVEQRDYLLARKEELHLCAWEDGAP